MNLRNTNAERLNVSTGLLFRATPPPQGQLLARRAGSPLLDAPAKHRLAFAGLYLFMVLMYFRPSEILPDLLGSIQLVKIVVISTLVIYVYSKYSSGERVITWPLEMKMAFLIWLLGLLFVPIAVSREDSFRVLFDPLIKILLIFILLIHLVDTRARLRSLLQIMVGCGFLYAFSAINTYLSGGFGESFDKRIRGWGTLISNPNDLACLLDLMLPLAMFLALTQRGWVRLFYFAFVVLAAVSVILTFSRSGFLALLAAGGTMIWKLSQGHRWRMLGGTLVLVIVLLLAMPGTYRARLATIINPATDTTFSAQGRQGTMLRAAQLALRHPLLGLGIGNFHIYSIGELRAHNSYLEIAAELGVLGFVAYLIFIFAPLRALRRLERATAKGSLAPDSEIHLASVCLQASFAAYIIYGFFGSVQYDPYLYHFVAYAVALRRIYAAEIGQATEGNARALVLHSRAAAHLPTGVLWRAHRPPQRWLFGGGK